MVLQKFSDEKTKLVHSVEHSSPVISLVKFKQCSYTPPKVFDAHCHFPQKCIKLLCVWSFTEVSEKNFPLQVTFMYYSYKSTKFLFKFQNWENHVCWLQINILYVNTSIKKCLINQNMKSNYKFQVHSFTFSWEQRTLSGWQSLTAVKSIKRS